MQPQPQDTSISIPITFDYKGGRNENKKNKIILSIILIVIDIIGIVGTIVNNNLEVYKKIVIVAGIFYVVLLLLRYFVFHERYYSDVYETLKEMDFTPNVTTIWKIFDIDYTYPYIAYFKNGSKGIFVKMEKDAVTGKGETARFDHYEAISEAYNKAHALNMDIRHIDYMDNVGNDSRLQELYDNLKEVRNPDMEDMLIDIYQNLQNEMSLNYASFDIYLFISRDKIDNFVYNMQTVCNTMIGGNFITYRALNRSDIRAVCMALFNLHDFSVTDSCEEVLHGDQHRGIVPIALIHSDGTIDKLNETQEERRLRLQEQARRQQEAKLEAKEAKRKKKKGNRVQVPTDDSENDDLNLFD